MKKIGILGGTFDPIHNGHLIIGEHIRDSFNLDKVLFIPCGNPPHKLDRTITFARHRSKMVRLAIKDNTYFEMSDIDIEREGYTYTVDTLKDIKKTLGEENRYLLIIGADNVHEILTWKNADELLKQCEFIAVLRPNYKKIEFLKKIKTLVDEYGAVIHVDEAPKVEISSTQIRKRISQKKTIKYLVPESVEKYIYYNKLYV